MLKPASNNIGNRCQMTKSPKIGLTFKILYKILMKLMQKLQFWSALRNRWWYFWDVRGKPIISKIEIEGVDIESILKS